MKRVLITATTYPLTIGDSQPRFIHDLAKGLRSKFTVCVLVPRGPGAKSDETLEDVSIRRYSYFYKKFESLVYGGGILENLKYNRWNYLLIPFLFAAQFYAIHQYVRKHDVHIINAHWIVPQGLVSVVLKELFGLQVKVIVTSHGGDLYGLQGRFLNKVKRWVIERADAVIVVSAAMREYCYQELGVNKEVAIRVRSMGVDLDRKFTCEKAMSDRNGLIFVGRLVEKKGVSILINTMSILNSRGNNIRLNIVGSGPELNALQKLACSLGVEQHVTFLGAKQSNEIPDILNSHQIFVMPSKTALGGDQEGLGLVAVEAMGCGCAVISSDLKPIRDVVEDGVNGLTFSSGDPIDLANKIESLLGDNASLTKFADTGRESVYEKFNWTKVSSEYAEIFDQI